MRILLISTGGHIGGEETFTRSLALSLINRGHIVWVAPGGEIQRADLLSHNIPVVDLAIAGRGPGGLVQGSRDITRFIHNKNVEIVHCQAAGPAIMGGFLRMIRRIKSVKWIYHAHGIRKTTYRWLPFFLNRLDLTITNSDSEMIHFKSSGVKADLIKRIHNGIDPNLYNFKPGQKKKNRNLLRNELGIGAEEFLVGYIGRLSPEKGCDLIIPAFQSVHKHESDTKLVIVGDGIMKEELDRESMKMGLSKSIFFTGFRSDIPEILCSLDVLILPSYMETFSLTTLQAMASGLPVIASDVGGNPEQIVSGYNGYLFAPGNTSQLSDLITRLKRDGNGDQLGSNGRALVDSYLNIHRMVDEIEYCYSN